MSSKSVDVPCAKWLRSFRDRLCRPRNKCVAADDEVCGLHNVGNTCYMNSALQCLRHTKQFREYLLGELDKCTEFLRKLYL